MVFCRQFLILLKAGITVTNALRVISRQIDNKAFQDKLDEVINSVEQGNTLADSFRAHHNFFPSIFINMVEAGEMGGILDDVMERLSLHFEKEYELKEKIKSALTYPLVILAVALLVVFFLVVVILPTFEGIFASMGAELPLMTRALLNVSKFIGTFWYLVVFSGILLIIGAKKYISSGKGRAFFDRAKLRIPVFGKIYEKFIISLFCRNLSTLITSGVSLLSAIDLVRNVINNHVYCRVLEKAEESISRGENMGSSLAQMGLFPPLVIEMITTGEETGNLDYMLEKAADFYEAEVSYHLERLSKTIEPMLIVFLAVIVGIIVLSILLPMLSIFQQIG